MLKNYFKTAWRSLLRNKVYTFINITGLATGIACFVLITLYVKDELSYDRYHKNVDQIYRVVHAYRNVKSNEKLPPPAPQEFQVWGNAPVGMALAADFPEVIKMAQFTHPNTYLLQYKEKRFQETNIPFADSSIFDVFTWKMLYGDARKALTAPNSIVLTKGMARKYFGDANPVGQAFKVDNAWTCNVTGVVDVPANSQFTFDGLISMSTFRQWRPEVFFDTWAWGYVDFYTYFVVPKNTDIKTLQAKVPDFLKRHHFEDKSQDYTISFEPLTAAYLHSQAGRQPGPTGSMSNVYIFSLVAIFVLLIACINFMNLSTARSMERAKEVGVRKAVGAYRHGLIYQFLSESVLLSMVAGLLAILLVIIALPMVRDVSGKPLPYTALLSWGITPMLIILPVVTGLLAGSYPAWVLARFKPVEVLKGKFESSRKGILLRKGLVVTQFSLSIALIAGTTIVFSQLDHLRSHQLGFRQDQLLVVDYGGDGAVDNSINAIKIALAQNPDVLSVSASRMVPGDFYPNAGTTLQTASGDMQLQTPAIYEIDDSFVPTYEMKMAAGRAFSPDFPSDTLHSLLLNEAAIKLWGYSSPADIIGKKFDQWGRQGTVIGVVKDFNYQSLHKKVEPLALRMAPPGALNKLTLRIKTGHLSQTIAALERAWATLVPQRPFLYSFLDQDFNRQYQQDQRFGEIFGTFAGLTILIACLGLFGLATYATEQRFKEIGIRKVLGASVVNIVGLLSSDFLKLVMIAIFIAVPLSWWAMDQWLDNFAYHITIRWWMLALAGLLALVIALVTVSFRTVKAALMNPVSSLRAE